LFINPSIIMGDPVGAMVAACAVPHLGWPAFSDKPEFGEQ
jgi:hypothetical protein